MGEGRCVDGRVQVLREQVCGTRWEGEHGDARVAQGVQHGCDRAVPTACHDRVEGFRVFEQGGEIASRSRVTDDHFIPRLCEAADEVVAGTVCQAGCEVDEYEEFHKRPFIGKIVCRNYCTQ